MVVTRFAPSPNGSLHLGHAYSAICAHDIARSRGGRFLLRIEDIDGERSLPEKAAEFREDLAWLGLEWEEVPAQSTRLSSYEEAARGLLRDGLLYPCSCTRKEIAALEPRLGPEGAVYPGTCKGSRLDPSRPAALRLDVDRALAQVGADAGELFWEDEICGTQVADPRPFGDVVLVRKDAPASYHLAATLDDAADGVTLVTRGQDLYAMTHIHRLLQELLGLPVPTWHHHPILLDENGEKLAKRRNSPSLADRRAAGEDGRALAERLRRGEFPAGITLASA
ncbi:tRNA glutamyl-Q(34) synthetase GluQRS [Qipengyuania sp. GH1]|uniref:tRNA glutamyl-Q(34) synthetase GluQRS n=1 Tax=Qipengyuania aestuarii TaxID=2867241 RepID=UPI001C871BCE|nr:tRNA glutamyl-Q(34) synthetase GluQRS [Qipengyuania aestuarii]MBX7536383.1 tRNA glutamyl-Q(34) synthetase GluQRS [Qipengyuania aestuarii]